MPILTVSDAVVRLVVGEDGVSLKLVEAGPTVQIGGDEAAAYAFANQAEAAAASALAAGRYRPTKADAEAAFPQVGGMIAYRDAGGQLVFAERTAGGSTLLPAQAQPALRSLLDAKADNAFQRPHAGAVARELGAVLGDRPFAPEDFGAVGDGAANDSDALARMIAEAGPGARIRLRRGRTYLVDTMLDLLQGQELDLAGATIKRAPQARTTLTAAFASNSSADVVLQVASTAAFRVGSFVTLTLAGLRAGKTLGGGADNPYGTDTKLHRVIAKTATTLTVQGSFFHPDFLGTCPDVTSYPAGSEVVAAFYTLRVPAGATDCTITGGTLDGRATGHGGAGAGWQVRGRRWENLGAILVNGDRTVLRDLLIRDEPGEGVMLGGAGSLADNCHGLNIGGNFIHVSGGEPTRVNNCHAVGANRVWIEHDGYSEAAFASYGTVGHENGAFAWSQQCRFVNLTDSSARNAKSLFGPPVGLLNDAATITGNMARDCRVAFYLHSFDELGRDVLIAGNRFYDCGAFRITRAQNGAPARRSQNRTILRDNFFLNTKAVIYNAHGLRWEGGFIRHDDPRATGPVIDLAGGSDILIDTTVDGAQYGLIASGTMRDVTIRGRWRRITGYGAALHFVDAASRGVRIEGADLVLESRYAIGDAADPASGDTAQAGATPGGTVGFYLGAGQAARGINARMAAGRAAIEVVGAGARVIGCELLSDPATTRGVIAGAGQAVITDNILSVAVRDDSGAAILERNREVAWQA